jgi:hypothetical protein
MVVVGCMRKRGWSSGREGNLAGGRRSRALCGEAVAGSRGGGVLYVSRQYERVTVSPCLKSSGLWVREGSCWERETGVQVGELEAPNSALRQRQIALLYDFCSRPGGRVSERFLLSQHDQGSENLVTT